MSGIEENFPACPECNPNGSALYWTLKKYNGVDSTQTGILFFENKVKKTKCLITREEITTSVYAPLNVYNNAIHIEQLLHEIKYVTCGNCGHLFDSTEDIYHYVVNATKLNYEIYGVCYE